MMIDQIREPFGQKQTSPKISGSHHAIAVLWGENKHGQDGMEHVDDFSSISQDTCGCGGI